MVLAAAVAATFLASGAPLRAADLRILWVQDARGSTRDDTAVNFAEMLEEQMGISSEVFFVGVQPGRVDQLLVAVQRHSFLGVDLVLGLTQSQIRVLEDFKALREISLSQIGFGEFQALALPASGSASGSLRQSQDPGRALGIPIELSLPVVCYDREQLGHLADYSPSILEISYGKVAGRVAMSDPRFDTVGRAVLLSSFMDAGGISGGWELVQQLDSFVDRYAATHWASCEAVAKGSADLGFTQLASAEVIANRWPRLGIQALRDGLFVPVYFAAAMQEPAAEEWVIEKVLNWLAHDYLSREFDALRSVAERENLDYSVETVMKLSSALDYFPTADLVNEWSARYDFKSERRE